MIDFIHSGEKIIEPSEPIIFENKTDASFGISAGIVFRKSGLYRVSIDGQRISVSIEPDMRGDVE